MWTVVVRMMVKGLYLKCQMIAAMSATFCHDVAFCVREEH
jgi:hypothetical protein